MISEKERGEIVQNYRLAKNKEEQVVIESEIHGVGSEVIRGILWDAGVYPIGPVQIGDAANKIVELGITFGVLRNYMKAFMDVDARTARKIFKDYIYRPWGDAVTTAAGVKYTDLAQILDIYSPEQIEKYSAGDIYTWAEDIARCSYPVHQYQPEEKIENSEFHRKYQELAEELIAKAGYRLAKLFNEILN